MSGKDAQIQNIRNNIRDMEDGEIRFGKTQEQMREMLSDALTRRAQAMAKSSKRPDWFDALQPEDGQIVTIKGKHYPIQWASGRAHILVNGKLTSPSATGKSKWRLDGVPMQELYEAAWASIKEKPEES